MQDEGFDETDRRILAALQRDARIPNARLAEEVGVSPSTSHARVRALVARGVVRRFAAELDPDALGLGIQALISVGIRAGARGEMGAFLDRVSELPQVLQAFFLGGSEDFIVHVAVRDSAAVRDFVERLSGDPVVSFTRTSLVFDHRVRPIDVG